MNIDERKISENLQHFVKMWETRKVDKLDECFAKNIRVYFSIFGRCYVLGTVRDWLSTLPHRDIKFTSMKLYNQAVVIDGDYARQSASMIGVFADDAHPSIRSIAFGGTFANEVIKVDGVWKIDTMRFELQMDNAYSDEFVAPNGLRTYIAGNGYRDLLGKWKYVNDRFSWQMDADPTQGLRVILAEFDSPWSHMQHRDNVQQDAEDAIKEVFAKYCFGNDFRMGLLISDSFADNAVISLSDKLQNLTKREAVVVLKQHLKGQPRVFHAGEFETLDVKDSTAHSIIHRLKPEKMTLTKAGDGEYVSDFGSATYDIDWVCEDGEWKIIRMQYTD